MIFANGLQPDFGGEGYVTFPTADDPSISGFRLVNTRATVAAFSASKWPLTALDGPDRPRYTVNFEDWPTGFVLFAKHLTYVLINHGNPPLLIETEGSIYTKWPAAGSIYTRIRQLRSAVVWLTGSWSDNHPETPVRTPADLDSEHLNDLKIWIDGRHELKKPHTDRLEIILRTWYLNPWLPDEMQWPDPLWKDEQWRPRRTMEDSKSLRIQQASMGPLLEWSVAFVIDFSSDILAAHTAYVDRFRTIAPEVGSSDACRDLLDQYLQDGRPLPGNSLGNAKQIVSWLTLANRHGISPTRLCQVYHNNADRYKDLAVDLDLASTQIQTDIVGQFHSRAWIPFISVHDLHDTSRRLEGSSGQLLRHLRTACLIVMAYLTGARPEEVLALEHGAAPEPILGEGGSRLHVIRGKVWKGATRKDDGGPATPREAVWATLSVAREAAIVLETIASLTATKGAFLFGVSERPPYTNTATGWIQGFVEFVNERLVSNTVSPAALTIPPDPGGNITLRRFRRTLAWFIRNQPDGEVILAIQYQHLSDVIGGGYAGTKQSGLTDLLAEEDWNHRRSTIAHLATILQSGQGISGPAAERVLRAVEKIPRLLTPADERRLRKDPDLVVYDNPSALTLCAFQDSMALCLPKGSATKNPAMREDRPNLLGCVTGCKCRARTDEQLERLARQSESLREQAAISPRPMAQSMIAEAEDRERQVDEFRAHRLVVPSCDESEDDER